jgi:WD40 repeat protein
MYVRWLFGLLVVSCVPAPASAQPADVFGDPLPPGAVSRLGTGRLRTVGDIFALAFSPDGKRLLSNRTSALQVWEAASGKALWNKAHYEDSGGTLAVFSADGKLLATDGALMGLVRVWNAEDGSWTRISLGKESATSLAWGPKNNVLAIGNNKGVVYLTAKTFNDPLHKLGTVTGRVSGLVWAPDGKTLVVVDGLHNLRWWDLKTGKEQGKLVLEAPVVDLAFTADGKSLAVLTDSSIEWVEAASRKTLRVTPHEVEEALAFWSARDGKQAAVAGDANGLIVRVFDPSTGKLLETVRRDVAARKLAFSPDGKTLAVGFADWRIELWQCPTCKPRLSFEGHGKPAWHIAFLPDGKSVATASDDGSWRVWDVETGKPLRVHEHGSTELSEANRCFSANGKLLVTAQRSGVLCLWDTGTGKVRCHTVGTVFALRDVSPCGKFALLRAFDEYLLWDLNAAKVHRRLGKLGPLGRTVLSRAGEWLAIRDVDIVRMWNIAAGKEQWRHKETALAVSGLVITFTPDGKQLAMPSREPGNESSVVFRNVADGKINKELKVPNAWEGTEVTYAAPGHPLVVTSGLRRISLYEGSTHLFLRGIDTPSLWSRDNLDIPLFARALSHDGTRLAFTLMNGTVLVADLGPPLLDLATRVKALTPAERDKLWTELAGNDGPEILLAEAVLAATPKDTVAFLKAKLAPVPKVTEKRVQQLLADLDAKEFKKREAAIAELAQCVEAAETALRKVLEKPRSLELRRRVEKLLELIEGRYTVYPSALLRVERGLQILERIGSPEARALLETLAKGDVRARQTQLAQAALLRLASRKQ